MIKSHTVASSSGVAIASSSTNVTLIPSGLIPAQAYVSYGQEIVAELLAEPNLRKALVQALAKELREELSPLLKALE
jgi:hypothetical protein